MAQCTYTFPTAVGATTLGVHSTFRGRDIDDAVITTGSNVTWDGRALGFGGTISTASDRITAPNRSAPATATAAPTTTSTPTGTATRRATATRTSVPTAIPPTSEPEPQVSSTGTVIQVAEVGAVAGGASTPPTPISLSARMASLDAVLPAHSASGPGTVLIVDDEPIVVRMLLRALKSEQLRLLSAGDGDAALELARSERPDVILLDWHMPGRAGLAVCRALRADADPHLRAVPVVLLTTMTSPGDTAAGFASGASDYLAKQFAGDHVRARVREWLHRRHITAGTSGATGAGPEDVRSGAPGPAER